MGRAVGNVEFRARNALFGDAGSRGMRVSKRCGAILRFNKRRASWTANDDKADGDCDASVPVGAETSSDIRSDKSKLESAGGAQ